MPAPPGLSAYDQELAADCRLMSADELHTRHATLALELVDLDALYGGDPVAADLLGASLRAVTAELRRRETPPLRRLALEADADAWADLARQVKARVDLVELFAAHGWRLTRTGHNARRGCDEYAGPCFVCGGRDRLRVWSGPPGAYWCRQCAANGDALTAYQQFHPGAGFRDALRQAAVDLGLPLPRPLPRVALTGQAEVTATGTTITLTPGLSHGR